MTEDPKERACSKFVCDAMLGKLARWLRVLGYSTHYFREIEDSELVAYARARGLVLITRDTRLARRRNVQPCVLIEENDPWDQIRTVVRRLGLEVTRERSFTLCVECNESLYRMNKADVRGIVPPYVYRTQQEFSRCPSCGRVYWPATHQQHMLEKLEELFNGDVIDGTGSHD